MHPRLGALAALRLTDPAAKVAATRELAAHTLRRALSTEALRAEGDDIGVPGRPERPLRVEPTATGKRSPFTAEGRAALVHAICHIEFNAIKIAFLVSIFELDHRLTVRYTCGWQSGRHCQSPLHKWLRRVAKSW